jgi:sugar (pentulose or hexulose) kinase
MLEGIAHIEHKAYQRLAELGAPYPSSIRTVGGGAVNEAWTQIRTRYCQTEILQSEYTEAAYGSALLAMQGYQNNIQ